MWQQLLLLSLCGLPQIVWAATGCNRMPLGSSGERSPVDDNFKLLIDGNPTTYIPEHQYNVSLACPFNLKFISFTLVVESEEPGIYGNSADMVGHFELFSDSDTRFSAACEHMIESTNTNAKTRIDVSWVAPKPESGCVVLKAGVVQHRDVWFIDDGFLTQRICPEEIDEVNSQTPPLEECCACDEAKYEIVLERRWARNTHSKHFPSEAWRTRLGELIGASHSYNYRYWAYGGRASLGLSELAEHGATRTLEQEIRDNTQNGQVRTIIKAPGIIYRHNVQGTTLANARVDPVHHQISLATKIDPSPDWILGVAGLELCLSNCTWVERKVLNLYPWDIGTDAGPSYMSADQPQVPPDVIRRITSSYPSDHRSPFFDGSGAPMKPLATLHLTRKKLYVRACDSVPQEGALECATHPWNEWSNCTARCGPGYKQRMRSYKNPALAVNYNCDLDLLEQSNCQGEQCGLEENVEDLASGMDAECELTIWSAWSACSKLCGKGIYKRTRDFRNRRARARCLTAITMPMEETSECEGRDCGGTIPNSRTSNYEEVEELPERDLFGETNEGGSSYNKPNWSQNNNEKSSWSSNRNDKPAWSSNSNEKSSWSSSRNDKPAWSSNSNEKSSWSRNEKPAWSSNSNENPVWSPNKNFNRPGAYTPRTTTNAYDNLGRQSMGYESDFDRSNSYQNEQLVGGRPTNLNDYNLASTRATPVQRYDEQDERRGLTVGGVDASNYNVVQEYCFEKPFASRRRCLAVPVVVSNYWFYDHEDHECKLFTTDNCDENKNRFRTLSACEGTCRQPQANLEQTDDADYGRQNVGMQSGSPFGAPMAQTTARWSSSRGSRYGS